MSDLLAAPDWAWLPTGTEPPTDDQLVAIRSLTEQMLADRGVTYGTESGPRPWQIDPVPVVLPAAAWAGLDAGVQQRAVLLDAIHDDLYGQRRLLSSGTIPPELVLSHPGFLRQLVDAPRHGGPGLVLTATDVTSDGSGWIVVHDRTQAPSGPGYAMVDRRVTAQALARVYRQTSIRRIGPFFRALRQALAASAPRGAREPRIVLLTAGPHSETAFDQAYLASTLGLPMVEGSDLLVRDGRVWMLGLDGMEPVDVILRRVDADWCDPLDLRSESRLGVPGLVRAVMAGTVNVVNPLGASVLEHPGLAAYLPAVARAVLGEDLLLGSPTTHWCGDAAGRAYVIAHMADLVLRPSIARADEGPVLGWQLSGAERESLAARIAAEPWAWTGQEPVRGRPDPETEPDAPLVIRTFTVASHGSHVTMAGGLALQAADGTPSLVTSARGAKGRDVWVLTGDGDDPAGFTGESEPEALLPRTQSGIAPRTAETMFWMGRYAERAGDTVRLLRVAVDRWDDFARRPRSAGAGALRALLDTLAASLPTGWTIEDQLATGGAVVDHRSSLHTLLTDDSQQGTAAWAVRRLAENAAAARDQLSADTWLPLGSMARALTDARLTGARGATQTAGMLPVLDRVLEALLAIAGIATEGMVRDAGWLLLDAGRRLERSLFLVDSLDSLLSTQRPAAMEDLLLESVLVTHESSITYRRRNGGRMAVPPVLALLLTDGGNPRALAYQLDRLRDDLSHLGSAHPVETRDRLLDDVTDLLVELDATMAADAVALDGRREVLAEMLESMRWRLRALGTEIEAVHFARPAAVHPLADVWGTA